VIGVGSTTIVRWLYCVCAILFRVADSCRCGGSSRRRGRDSSSSASGFACTNLVEKQLQQRLRQGSWSVWQIRYTEAAVAVMHAIDQDGIDLRSRNALVACQQHTVAMVARVAQDARANERETGLEHIGFQYLLRAMLSERIVRGKTDGRYLLVGVGMLLNELVCVRTRVLLLAANIVTVVMHRATSIPEFGCHRYSPQRRSTQTPERYFW
jgi:hypothetical protein